MSDETKKCPACAETIKAEAKICRFCGATFELMRHGYCTTDHALTEADENGKCKKCGNEVIDFRIETRLIAEGGKAAIPTVLPTPMESPTPSVNAANIGEATRITKVKTAYFSSFNIPHHCVACGDLPGSETKTTFVSKSDWSGKHTTTLSLNFPLCQECSRVSKGSGFAGFVRIVGGLVSVGLCWFTAILANGGSENALVGIGVGLLILFVTVFLVRGLSERIEQRGLTPEQISRRKIVGSSVRVSDFKMPGLLDKKGWILFEFSNPSYAIEFLNMNLGEIA